MTKKKNEKRKRKTTTQGTATGKRASSKHVYTKASPSRHEATRQTEK